MALPILAILAQSVSLWVIAAARQRLSHTTLVTAWGWALAANVLALGSGIVDSLLGMLPSGWGEILWYFTAIVGLCPAIAVLGARRPMSRVWNLFVIVPLLAVLGWPAMAVLLMDGLNPRELHLEAPPLAGFGLVLVMGNGNYVGTRYIWCVVLGAVGQLLLLGSLAVETWATPTTASVIRPLGLICLSAGPILARCLMSSRDAPPAGVDRVWSDFQNSFGIVWARRIMEHFNQEAHHKQWQVRLDPGGLSHTDDSAARPRGLDEGERFMRWLLRRFVDEEWINARTAPPQSSDPTSEHG
jgi:hypothetical protein